MHHKDADFPNGSAAVWLPESLWTVRVVVLGRLEVTVAAGGERSLVPAEK